VVSATSKSTTAVVTASPATPRTPFSEICGNQAPSVLAPPLSIDPALYANRADSEADNYKVENVPEEDFVDEFDEFDDDHVLEVIEIALDPDIENLEDSNDQGDIDNEVQEGIREVRGRLELIEPSLDEHGLIRIGFQPLPIHPNVFSAPETRAKDRIRESVRMCLNIDRQSYRLSDYAFSAVLEPARKQLGQSFVPHRDGWVKRLCDYTGMLMSWAPIPGSVSIEAAYYFGCTEKSANVPRSSQYLLGCDID
jgi:hypothetical protein